MLVHPNPQSLRYSRSLAISITLLLLLGISSCVGKGKYFVTLERAERATSEAAVAKTDLANSLVLRDRLERNLLAQSTIIEQLNQDKQSANNLQLKTSQSMADQERQRTRERDRLLTQLDSLTRVLALERSPQLRKDERLQRVESSLRSALRDVPDLQYALGRTPEYVSVSLSENLLFAERKMKVSRYGDALISQLARALGGQQDLDIQLICYPHQAAVGSEASWKEATQRAAVLAHNLVVGHGINPQLVSATGREGEVVVVDGAPAEARLAQQVQVLVRIAP